MKKTIITCCILISAITSICWSGFQENTTSSLCDSPIVGDHSGAPGETNCTACHSGSANTGSGILEFHVGNDSTYIPGQTYTCNVKMTQAGIDKFGFVNLALKNSGNTTIGTFNIIDSIKTRKYALGGRNYFSHTPCGADADSIGEIQWTYSWTAPSTDVGSITFYISSLAANHDHDVTADYTYTHSIELDPETSSKINESYESSNSLIVFPNPISDFISIAYENLISAETEIKLLDMQGRTILIFSNEIEKKGEVKKLFNIPKKSVAPGVYWLNISSNNRIYVNKKILIF